MNRQLLVTTLISLFVSFLAKAQTSQIIPSSGFNSILEKSRESLRQKNFAMAMHYADSAISINPNSQSAIMQRGAVFFEIGAADKALVEYKKANELCGNCNMPFISLAWLDYAHGFIKEAYKLIDEVLKNNPSNPVRANLYFTRGEMKMHQADYDNAYIDYCKAYDLVPTSLVFLDRMILHEIHVPKDSLLVKEHLRLFNIDDGASNASMLYASKGFIYSLMKKYQDALDNYEEAFRLNPKSTDALVHRGLMKLYLNRPTEATEDMEQALVLFPNSAVVWNNRGFIKLYQNKYEEAIKDLEKSLQIDSTVNPEAYNNRGYIYYKKGGKDNLKKALEDYDRAIAVGSKIYNPYWKYRDSVVSELNKL